MKHALIALTVFGVAGSAMGQSSVTLYGVADASLARTQSLNPDGTKTNFTGMSSAGNMNNGTSRLGVRGVEDLGGGLKAGFNFEAGLALTDGSANKSGGEFFSRQANVWLGGGWGRLTLGRAFNPSFYGAVAWDLTGQANYSVVGVTYGFGVGQGPRSSSQFMYETPEFGGFKGYASYVPKDNNVGADDVGRNKFDLGAVYKNGPVAIGASANKEKGRKTNYGLGGVYRFGDFAVGAGYMNMYSMAAAPFGDTSLRRRGYMLEGQYAKGPYTLTLMATRDTKRDVLGGTGLQQRKNTNALLEGKYSLSKRTTLYAAYLRFDKTNNYGLGVRHNF